LIFRLGAYQIISGVEEAVRKMSKGQICRVRIPPELGYGESGYPPIIPPLSTLIYEIELISFSNESSITINPRETP